MREGTGLLILLLVRGVLLWVAIPAGVIAWFLLLPLVAIRRKHVTLRALLGWIDLNLIATLEATLLRRLIRERQTFLAWSQVRTHSHRVNVLDAL